MLRIFLKKGLVTERMTLCAIRCCSSFKTRVTSVKAAAAPKSRREAHCVNMLLLQPWPEAKWFGKILSGAGVMTDPDKIRQIVQAGKSKTIEDVRNQPQAEANNAKYGRDHKEDQSHEEEISTLRKGLTKDGGNSRAVTRL